LFGAISSTDVYPDEFAIVADHIEEALSLPGSWKP
jgi:hypothetical protein